MQGDFDEAVAANVDTFGMSVRSIASPPSLYLD